MQLRLLALSLAAIGIAGCGEPYVRPPAPVPADWSGRSGAAVGRLEPALTGWKNFFVDPQLQSLIAAAMEHNRDLRVATARIEEARAQHGIAQADRLPAVNLTGGLNAAMTPTNLGGSNQSVTGQRLDVSLSAVSFELDFWGRISGLTEAARASYLASEAAQRALRLSLVAEVASAYFAYLEAEERVGIARAGLASVEQSAEVVLKAHRAGYASATERIHAQSATEAARATLAGAIREQENAVNLLQFLTGKTPDRTTARKPLAAQLSSIEIAVGLPSDVLLSRPDVLAAEQRLIAANANIGAARAAFLPKILLTGLFGTSSSALAGLFAAGSQSWSFQPSLSLPLFDGGRLAANIDIAEARKVVAVAEYERTIQQAFWEIANLLSGRTALRKQLDAGEANLSLKEEQREVANAIYRGGQTGYLEVLSAEREVLAAHQNVVQLHRSLLTVTTQLYKALGGGGGR